MLAVRQVGQVGLPVGDSKGWTIRHAIDEPHVVEAVLTNAELRAFNSFWEYRINMNPRLTLRDMWFPRSLGGSCANSGMR